MCSAPKAPKVEKIPVHQAMVMPDGGDPTVRGAIRGQRRLMRSAMMFSGSGGTLGAPAVANPGNL
jgi:hypothetical protein